MEPNPNETSKRTHKQWLELELSDVSLPYKTTCEVYCEYVSTFLKIWTMLHYIYIYNCYNLKFYCVSFMLGYLTQNEFNFFFFHRPHK